ncbi:tail fiber assembly protein [Pseudomonas monteilii]|uniref:tail fiber assembly protein n=1 Tax=Pseudomonas monteilii TaxID=76759 RepID=UPI001FD56B41|nr:tail fiber assembly protein [Pseudomonas monteilii]MCJ7854582.1 tail fiber assembly protein [Pseudomonas monteilii]
MIIKLTPQEMHPPQQLAVWKNGEQLNINGLAIDLARLAEGSTLPAAAINSPWLAAPIERRNGQLVLTLFLPNGPDSTVAERFPSDLNDVPDGLVALPGKPADQHFPTLGYASIDWDQVQTAAQKAEALALAILTQRRKDADLAIAPLADAERLDMATEAEAALLEAWQRYRILLTRVPEQPDYPITIDWPTLPA